MLNDSIEDSNNFQLQQTQFYQSSELSNYLKEYTPFIQKKIEKQLKYLETAKFSISKESTGFIINDPKWNHNYFVPGTLNQCTCLKPMAAGISIFLKEITIE